MEMPWKIHQIEYRWYFYISSVQRFVWWFLLYSDYASAWLFPSNYVPIIWHRNSCLWKSGEKILPSVTESGYSCVLGSSLKFCSHGYLQPAAVPIDPKPHSYVCLSGVCWQAYMNRIHLNNIWKISLQHLYMRAWRDASGSRPVLT